MYIEGLLTRMSVTYVRATGRIEGRAMMKEYSRSFLPFEEYSYTTPDPDAPFIHIQRCPVEGSIVAELVITKPPI
jgi:hypothetical protein